MTRCEIGECRAITLTTGIDNIAGTSGNDTILGDFTAAASINAPDQVNGGAGVDTFKAFGTYNSALMPTVTNVEVLEFALPTVAAGATLDVSGIVGLTKLQIDAVNSNAGAATFKTASGVTLQLANTTGNAAGLTTWTASNSDATLNLILNGINDGGNGVTVTGTAATTLNVASQGGSNTVSINAPATVTKIVVTGDKALNTTAAAATSTVKTVDASAATGAVQFSFAEVGKTFTGGSGNDTVKFAADKLDNTSVLVGGAGTDVLAVALTTPGTDLLTSTNAVVKGINAATGFETLAASTAATVIKASLITNGIVNFRDDVAGAFTVTDNTSAGTISINANVASGANDFTIANKLGELTANLGITASSAGASSISQLVLTGVTTLNVTSDFSGTGAQATANTVTLKTNADNSVFNLKATGQALIFNGVQATTTGSTIDGNTSTKALTITGTVKSDSIIGGSAADTLQVGTGAANALAGQADTLKGGAGADTFKFSETFGVSAATSLASLLAESAGTAGIVKITDFVTGTDKVFLNTSGTAFTAPSMTLATAQTVATAADLTGVYAGITAISASATTGAMNGVLVTVTAGAAAGTYLYINDATAGVSNTADMLINITGVTGTVTANDFIFA